MQVPLTLGRWIAALVPIVVLFVLITSGRVKARTAALAVTAVTVVLATAVYGAGPLVLGVALVKGLWLGLWILAVVWPAMLLYQIASRAGLDRIGGLFASLFPNRSENLLVLAWLLPSFVQGVAGFGAPIAVAAPLLIASGWSRGKAVIYPLVGYHWSVTFGSMGSSFYMAALTAHLGSQFTETFARAAALLLGVNCLVAGAIVVVLDGGVRGLRDGAPLLFGAGLPMAVTLYFVAPVVPAVGTVSAGAVGFAVALGIAWVGRLRRRTHGSPCPAGTVDPDGTAGAEPGTMVTERGATGGRGAIWLVAPYLYLVGTALVALLVPASRQWISTHAVLGPSLPATTTGLGWHNAAVARYTPLEVFGHPGVYLLLACLLGYLTYRATGLWHRAGRGRLVRDWLGSVQSTSISIVGLACVATVLMDAGMIATLARGLVAVTGAAYPALAPLVGALGSFLTGSSTSSNALFAALQAQVSQLLDVPAAVLLAAQTAGANVGNSVAPVVVLIGLSAVDAQERLSRVVRTVAIVTLGLLVVVTGMTFALLFFGDALLL